MSTLKVNKVQHNTSGFSNVVQFTDGSGTENGTLCRAWVSFNGYGTVAIRDSFNVTSITDDATGKYTMNFTNAMDDANYACVGGSRYAQNGTSILSNFHDAETTTSVKVYTVGSAYYDCERVDVAIFR